MEHWLDGDKWDQVGKYTESDFEEDINNIHYDKTMLLAAHMGKPVHDFQHSDGDPQIIDLRSGRNGGRWRSQLTGNK